MENLGQAVLIMVLGMGGVYVFLTTQALITVALLRLAPADEASEAGLRPPASAILGDHALVPATVTAAPSPVSTAAPAPSVPAVVIIQAAIAAYESDQGAR